MPNIQRDEFIKRKQSGAIFPVFIEMNLDQITPIGIYYNLEGRNKFLLESVFSEREIGRYSFIGSNPYRMIQSFGDEIVICREEGAIVERSHGLVLDQVREQLLQNYEAAGLQIPFVGGAVGYVGYDVIRQYEKLEGVNDDEIKAPETCLMFYRDFVCYDHYRHRMIIVANVLPEDTVSYEEVLGKLDKTARSIKENSKVHEFIESDGKASFLSNVTEGEYCGAVKQAKEYIKAGDIFQVVLSQRLTFETRAKHFDIYRRLRAKNPSPYLFSIDFGDFQIIGSSPESLVTVAGERVITNPIAGTRPRGKTEQEDERLKAELLGDEKERAEHIMLVDLGRNDIGKISEFGSVRLDRFMEVDFYSHVMHIVSMVSGKLKKGLTCLDALVSCLPVGTVSGAPKIRAMEIIDELENTKRGIYAGAVGYFSYDGNMDTCIGIRTIVIKENKAYVQAGAGIVHDSIPGLEYQETLNKAMGLLEVI